MDSCSKARQEQRHDKILKELLRLPDNKRCFDCDGVGPQYVVSNFHIFVCTSCSGIHRQFGHRVKGVSMCTFKPEEIKALQEGGNGRFAAAYLAKWQPSALPKPSDRSTDRVREWIQTVFDSKRFFDAPGTPSAQSPQHRATAPPPPPQAPAGGVPAVRQLTEVLGSGTPKLHVGGRADSLEHSNSRASSVSVAQSSAAARQLNLLDISSPKAGGASPASAAAPSWGAFAGPASSTAAGAAEGGWDAFGPGAGSAPASNGATPAAAAPATAPAWEAFGDESPSSAACSVSATAQAAAPAVGSSPAKPAQQGSPALPRPAPRPEVPIDVFYPEFEQIRATGILPTGQPVPRQMYAAPPTAGYPPPGYPAGAGGHPQYAQRQYQYAGQQPQYQAPQEPQYAYQQQQYQAPQQSQYAYQQPRPTVAVPGQYGGGPGQHYGAPSPAYTPGAAPAPGYASPGGFSPGVLSPAGSSGYAVRGSASSLPGHQQAKLGDPASDPFHSLAPSLRSVLPGAGGAPWPAASAAVPAPAPSPTPAAAATNGAAAASATLFGGQPSLAAMPYNLAAPAAPKPKASGNPFA